MNHEGLQTNEIMIEKDKALSTQLFVANYGLSYIIYL